MLRASPAAQLYNDLHVVQNLEVVYFLACLLPQSASSPPALQPAAAGVWMRRRAAEERSFVWV